MPLLFFGSPTWAQMVTGNDLIEACGGPSGEQQGFCIGYIMGVTEGIRLGVGAPFMIAGEMTTQEINEVSNSLLMYCARPEVTAAQNVAVVKKITWRIILANFTSRLGVCFCKPSKVLINADVAT